LRKLLLVKATSGSIEISLTFFQEVELEKYFSRPLNLAKYLPAALGYPDNMVLAFPLRVA
jgi:hypothetical protein